MDKSDTGTHSFALGLVLPRKQIVGAAGDSEDLNHRVERQLNRRISIRLPIGNAMGLTAIISIITVRVMRNRGAKAGCRRCGGSRNRRKENEACGRGGETAYASATASASTYCTYGAESPN